ncbi:unnamed protein product, partial [Medioppia subpectinata]
MKRKPVKVDVSVFVLNIRSIKETELTYVADIFYHQYWTDYRLQALHTNDSQNIVLDNSWKKKLWIPDSYFKNALDGRVPDIIFPTQYFVITNTTTVFMASRTQYNVTDFSSEGLIKKYAIGNFSMLRGRIVLTRQLGLYILKNYIPSALIVIMSFVGFWIPISAYPARVALVITALLALITQQYQSSQVNVSYIIAINVWMITCIAFVFLALIEYAFAITYHDNITAKANKIKAENHNHNTTEAKENSTVNPNWFKVYAITGFNARANRIDMISRYLFPSGFRPVISKDLCKVGVIEYIFNYNNDIQITNDEYMWSYNQLIAGQTNTPLNQTDIFGHQVVSSVFISEVPE